MEHQWSFTIGKGFINAFNMIIPEKQFQTLNLKVV